jgi:hypothetical protein
VKDNNGARQNPVAVTFTRAPDDTPSERRAHKPSVTDLLETPGALLSRTHLRELGWGRRGVDAIFRECPTVCVPGYSRPLIRVSDYLALLESSTYADDRVRPT